jgi:hypothetical protein
MPLDRRHVEFDQNFPWKRYLFSAKACRHVSLGIAPTLLPSEEPALKARFKWSVRDVGGIKGARQNETAAFSAWFGIGTNSWDAAPGC